MEARTDGVRPQLYSIDLLGLALWFLKSRCTIDKLSLIFGVVPATCNVWLNYALEVLSRVVNRRAKPDFEIRWPTESEMMAFAGLLERNRQHEPLIRGVFAVMDGGRIPCVSYGVYDIQNAFWERFKQSHEVANLFIRNFSGYCIQICG